MADRVIFDIGWVPFGIGHPPPTHQIHSTCVQEGSRIPNLQTEFNYLNSFKSYGIFSDFIVLTWSPWSPCHPHTIPIAPRRSPCGPHGLWSPWSQHVVPVVPTSSPSSPHHLEGPHIIPDPPRYPLHPPPPHQGGGPQISKNAIRF